MLKKLNSGAKLGSSFSRGLDVYKKNFLPIFLATLLMLVIGMFSFGICIAPLLCGLFAMILVALRSSDAKLNVGDVFQGFQKFVPAFVGYLVLSIIGYVVTPVLACIPVVGWIALIPAQAALYAAMLWSLFLVTDQEASVGDAITVPLKLLGDKRFWSVVVIVFVAGIVGALGVVAFGIGILVTIPLAFCIIAAAYEEAYSGAEVLEETTISDSGVSDPAVANSSLIKVPKKYYVRQKIWPPKLMIANFIVCNDRGDLLRFARLKRSLKQKDEIFIYNDRSMTKELMHFKQCNTLAFSGRFELSNPETGEVYGVWRRDGMVSLIVESWYFCKPDDDNMIMARIMEDSTKMALFRRYKATSAIANLFYPRSYRVLSQDGKLLATFKRGRNPIRPKLYVTKLESDMEEIVDAAAILLNSAGNEKFSPSLNNIKVG